MRARITTLLVDTVKELKRITTADDTTAAVTVKKYKDVRNMG